MKHIEAYECIDFIECLNVRNNKTNFYFEFKFVKTF
jgi:hypothetical protein